jgi:hypothetical protein
MRGLIHELLVICPDVTVRGKAPGLNFYAYCGPVRADAQHVNLSRRGCATPRRILSRDRSPNTPPMGFKLALEESPY